MSIHREDKRSKTELQETPTFTVPEDEEESARESSKDQLKKQEKIQDSVVS